MLNFYELLLDVLNEKGKSYKDLESSGVLNKNTFYIFKKTAPSLKTIIKIANYLELSVDYLLARTNENNFKTYKLNQTNFYCKLENIREQAKVSQSKFCRDLGISRTNFSRWSKGTMPSLPKLLIIADYLKCSIDDLIETES